MPEIVPCTQVDARVKRINMRLGEVLIHWDGGAASLLECQCIGCATGNRAIGATGKYLGGVIHVVGAWAVAVVAGGDATG